MSKKTASARRRRIRRRCHWPGHEVDLTRLEERLAHGEGAMPSESTRSCSGLRVKPLWPIDDGIHNGGGGNRTHRQTRVSIAPGRGGAQIGAQVSCSDQSSELQEVTKAWVHLTDSQRESVLVFVRALAAQSSDEGSRDG